MPAVTSRVKLLQLAALVVGVLGTLCALLIPFVPVNVTEATIDWPGGDRSDVSAPLVAYAPLDIDVQIPCERVAGAPDGTVLFSTIPPTSDSAARLGLVVKIEDGAVNAVLRNRPLADPVPVVALAGPQRPAVPADWPCVIGVHSSVAETTVDLGGHKVIPGDLRPQIVGLYSDLADKSGLQVHVNLDSRFSSSPSTIKLAAIIVSVLCAVATLMLLAMLDRTDGRRHRRLLPAHWQHISLADVGVVGTLLFWHIVGANTSDDGYILTMAREAEHSGYMSNYYRWYSVAEAPFGWYYDFLSLLTHISTASPFVRLPALVCGLLCWLLISREVIPRLGTRVRRYPLALWTGGLVFLTFWLPFNNGLRPEPIIAMGALLTWCLIERSIATGRLLPAALGVLVAAFSLAAGPSGLICIAAMIAGSRAILHIALVRTRARILGLASLVAGFAAVGAVVLAAVFADQSFAAVSEATRVRTDIGPNWKWFDERVRWDYLLMITTDGSLSRRFGVFIMLLCLVAVIVLIARHRGRIPGTSRGPSARLAGLVVGSLFLMMFTPTKWTHHFGVYAGIGGALAALAAMAVASTVVTSPRNRTLFAAAVAFCGALAFSSTNGWWYVSSYGVPWWDKPPTIAGKGFATLLLAGTVALLMLAAIQHYLAAYGKSTPKLLNHLTSAPVVVGAAFMVLFEIASLTKGAITQYPSYSVAKSNLENLTGKHCGLADEVLVEPDVNASVLTPVAGALADSLQDPAQPSTGFTPNGVAEDLAPDEISIEGAASSVAAPKRQDDNTTDVQAPGINGSLAALPFGFDPARTPVMGSFDSGTPQISRLTSQWFRLDRPGPLLTVAVAGRIASVDADGVATPGQKLVVEFGKVNGSKVDQLGQPATPIDIGPAPAWRNLRVPLDLKPGGADAVRIVATDEDLTPSQWLAVTPPRMPVTQTLQQLVGSQTPVLLDWAVGLAFGCQRPFHHHLGIAEVPHYRILPDREGTEATNAWQDAWGGGPLGWTDLLLRSTTVPTYLNGDWDRDWGALERYTPRRTATGQPNVTKSTTSHTGRWNPGPIRDK